MDEATAEIVGSTAGDRYAGLTGWMLREDIVREVLAAVGPRGVLSRRSQARRWAKC